MLQIAQEANIRSDAGLDDLANSLELDNRVPTSGNQTEKDEEVQYEVCLVQGQSTKRGVADLRIVGGQPVAVQGKYLFHET